MGSYILKRLLSAIPVLLGITIIVFAIMALIPGDPATAILGSYATPENVEKLNRDLGLDKPAVARYFIWLGNMLTGDFGQSFALNRPVLDEVLERFNATLVLAGVAFVLCCCFGILAGVISASRQYGLADKAITFVVLLGISIPSFFLGMMMILLFAVNLSWLPVSGMYAIYGGGDLSDLLKHLVMPARGPGGGGDGCDRAAVAIRDARGAAPGFHPHRARQGRARAPGDLGPCPARRDGLDHPGAGASGRVRAVGGGLYRDRVSVARDRTDAGRCDPEARHPAGAGRGRRSSRPAM